MAHNTLKVVAPSIYPLEGRQPDSFAAEIRISALIRLRARCAVLRGPGRKKRQGAFMNRMPAVGGGHRIRGATGRWSIRAASFLRQVFLRQVFCVGQVFFVRGVFVHQVFSLVSDCFETLRGVAADFVSVPSAFCTRQAAPAAITIPIQAKGERRASRFNY